MKLRSMSGEGCEPRRVRAAGLEHRPYVGDARLVDPGIAEAAIGEQKCDGHIVQVNPQSAFIDDFELVPSPASAMPLALAAIAALLRR